MLNIYSKDAWQATQQLSSSLRSHLETGEKVLWLMSGGSGGVVSLDVAKLIQDLPLENLYVTMSDERYGAIGHTDENWQILLENGLNLKEAQSYRVLNGKSIDETTSDFANWLKDTLGKVDYVIGIFGVGADGHTAGIKPHSPAVSSQQLAASFTGDDFQRITVTPMLLTHVDEAVVQAFGQAKQPTLAKLINQTINVDEQPAQALKVIKNLTLYSDYQEG